MKLKKVLTVLFTSMMLLTFSSSANAATGIGDTKNKAITISPGDLIQLFISNDQDQDWYVYTNKSGQDGFFFASLNPSTDYQNFRFGFQIEYSNGRVSEISYADPYPGPAQLIGSIYIPAGAKVYFIVKKTNNVLSQYEMRVMAP